MAKAGLKRITITTTIASGLEVQKEGMADLEGQTLSNLEANEKWNRSLFFTGNFLTGLGGTLDLVGTQTRSFLEDVTAVAAAIQDDLAQGAIAKLRQQMEPLGQDFEDVQESIAELRKEQKKLNEESGKPFITANSRNAASSSFVNPSRASCCSAKLKRSCFV